MAANGHEWLLTLAGLPGACERLQRGAAEPRVARVIDRLSGGHGASKLARNGHQATGNKHWNSKLELELDDAVISA